MMERVRVDEGALRMEQQKQNIEGYTLIEFLLVVILISIIAAVIIPRFSYKRILKQKVYVVAHEIAADLRYTQRLSLSGNRDVGTALPALPSTWPTQQTYWFKLYSATSAATDTFNVFKLNDEANFVKTTSTYKGDIVINCNSTDSFYFNTRGEPYPTEGGVISVSNSEGDYQWDVSIARTTGRVSLIQIK